MRHRNRAVVRGAAIGFAALAASALAGCEPTYSNHGFMPQLSSLDDIRAGEDTRGSVLRKLGQPSSISAFDDADWFYSASRVEHYAFYAPEVVDRKVVAVSFDDAGLVTKVDSYGIEDGRIVSLITRRTPTYGRELTVLQQIFGNLGRFNAEQFTSPGRPPGVPGG